MPRMSGDLRFFWRVLGEESCQVQKLDLRFGFEARVLVEGKWAPTSPPPHTTPHTRPPPPTPHPTPPHDQFGAADHQNTRERFGAALTGDSTGRFGRLECDCRVATWSQPLGPTKSGLSYWALPPARGGRGRNQEDRRNQNRKHPQRCVAFSFFF